MYKSSVENAIFYQDFETVYYKLHFIQNRMRFFRIVLQPELDKSSLILPDMFVRHYGESLLDKGSVMIRVPACDKSLSWKVTLKKNTKGEVWLSKGWPELAHFLQFQFGYLLMFNYKEAKHEFHLAVMDKTTCEIQYPVSEDACVPKTKFVSNHQSSKVEDGDIDVILLSEDDEVSSMGERASRSCMRSRKENKRSKHAMEGMVTENENNQMKEKFHKDKATVQLGNQCGTQFVVGRVDKASETIIRAMAFEYLQPVLIIKMHKYYLYSSVSLYVRKDFVLRYFNLENKYITLKIHGKGHWPVTYGIIGKRGYFKQGWRKFVVENKLMVGDVCAFELVKDVANTLEVRIFRKTVVVDKEGSSADTDSDVMILDHEHGTSSGRKRLARPL